MDGAATGGAAMKLVAGALLFVLLGAVALVLAMQMVQLEFAGDPWTFTRLLGQSVIVLGLMIMVYYRSGLGGRPRRS